MRKQRNVIHFQERKKETINRARLKDGQMLNDQTRTIEKLLEICKSNKWEKVHHLQNKKDISMEYYVNNMKRNQILETKNPGDK